MLLAYTGTRFRQLQEWQNRVFPAVLCRGVKNRDMTDVSVGLRVEFGSAQASNDAIVGIKLDQSKCFDRLIPDFTAALFLAFGMPKGIVNVFVKMYSSLKRHLSYRGWVSSTATTASNGAAQGRSLSLLAINVHMAVWSKFMSLIPHVCCRVFIDDAYLWVGLSKVNHLATALQVTEQWNALIGQKLNPTKSSLWASNSKARKSAKKLFPTIPLVLEFDALGAKIYTSQREAFQFPDQKVVKIGNDTKNIAALPTPTKVNCQLIASKSSRSVHLLLTSRPFRSCQVPKSKVKSPMPFGVADRIGEHGCSFLLSCAIHASCILKWPEPMSQCVTFGVLTTETPWLFPNCKVCILQVSIPSIVLLLISVMLCVFFIVHSCQTSALELDLPNFRSWT